MSYTCPRCGKTSHNENDEKYGYCAACGDFTAGDDTLVREFIDEILEQETERGVWRETMRHLAIDFRAVGWHEQAAQLDKVTNTVLHLLAEIEKAKVKDG